MLEALFARIDDQREALVELTRELVQVPTVNPPGDAYNACARAARQPPAATPASRSSTCAPRAQLGDSERYPRVNVIGRYDGRGPGPCVHFNGHLDVVEPGHGWSVDPFAGMVHDGRLYGRGACDMKGGIAAAVVALESIIEEGIRFPGALEISGTVDEESGGYAGVAWLAGQGYFSRPRVDHVIIPEPLDVDRICIGHRGVWWAEVETLGRVAHGSMPFLGDCAIRHMGAFLNRLERHLLPRLASRADRDAGGAARGARARRSTSTRSTAGSPTAATACRARWSPTAAALVIDRRFLIEEDLAEVKAEIVAILEQLRHDRPGFRYRIRDLMEVLPSLTPRDAPVVARGRGRDRAGARPPRRPRRLARHLRPEARRSASAISRTASPTAPASSSSPTSPTSTSRSTTSSPRPR